MAAASEASSGGGPYGASAGSRRGGYASSDVRSDSFSSKRDRDDFDDDVVFGGGPKTKKHRRNFVDISKHAQNVYVDFEFSNALIAGGVKNRNLEPFPDQPEEKLEPHYGVGRRKKLFQENVVGGILWREVCGRPNGVSTTIIVSLVVFHDNFVQDICRLSALECTS